MGANVSTIARTFDEKVENSLKQTCKPSSSTTQIIANTSLKNIKCPDANITISNKAKVYSNCDIATTAQSLASSASQLTQEQKAGLAALDLNVSDSQETNATALKTYLENSCSSTANMQQTIDNTHIDGVDACKFIDISNQADAQATCVLAALSKIKSQITSSTKTSQATDIGTGVIAMVSLCCCLVVVGGSFILLKDLFGCFLIQIVVILLGSLLISIGSGLLTQQQDNSAKSNPLLGKVLIGLGVVILLGGVIWFGYKYNNKTTMCAGSRQIGGKRRK